MRTLNDLYHEANLAMERTRKVDFEAIRRGIQERADYWQRWESEEHREEVGIDALENERQHSVRGQYDVKP